jgi:hypothetical protein
MYIVTCLGDTLATVCRLLQMHTQLLIATVGAESRLESDNSTTLDITPWRLANSY